MNDSEIRIPGSSLARFRSMTASSFRSSCNISAIGNGRTACLSSESKSRQAEHGDREPGILISKSNVLRYNKQRMMQLIAGGSYNAALRMANTSELFDFYLFLKRWFA